MRPVLFWVWSYPIPTHDFFVLLGVLAGVALVFHEARRRDMLDDRLLLILAGSLVCGAATAPLSALWRHSPACARARHPVQGLPPRLRDLPFLGRVRAR